MATRATTLALAVATLALGSACGSSSKSDNKQNQTPTNTETGGTEDAGTGATNDDDAGVAATLGGCVQPETMPAPVVNGITLPDSLCDDTKCQVGGCDPKGLTEPACNAYLLEAKGSFQAVKVSDSGTIGLPPPPKKSDSDSCPGIMTTPANAAENCCQRVAAQGDKPALKMASLLITRPASFGAAAVSESNKAELESDLYNWVIQLSSGQDGDGTATSGNALPLTDGTFKPFAGKFSAGGMTWNADGSLDAHTNIPSKLTTDGSTRNLCLGPSESNKTQMMAVWFDEGLDFHRLYVPFRGATWSIPLTQDLLCGGLYDDSGWQTVARLRAFMPVDDLRKIGLYLAKTGEPLNMCAYTSGALTCDGSPSTWKP